MIRWWKNRTVRLRLALWYAAVTGLVMGGFAVLFYHSLQQRLAAEIDRQLRIDFDLIEAQVEPDADGKMRWLLRGSHGDEGYARLSAWFEVWAENGDLLLRHWPVPEARIQRTLPPPSATSLHFYTAELDPGLHVRIMERPARILSRGVILRIFRDETEMRRTLLDTLEVLGFGLPLAILLSSLGGYFIAGRSLAPVGEMAAQARRITSESLDERLPVHNPNDELGKLAVVFNETLTRLGKSFEEIRQFSADASHELRSPLTAMRTVGEVGLKQAQDEAALRETIASMLEEAQHLADLVDTLLLLSRMDHDHAEAKKPILARHFLEDIQSVVEVLATEKRQTLRVDCDPALEIRADPILLRHAMINIVHNAIRYSPESTAVTMRAFHLDGRVAIETADEGPGIAPEHQAAVFDRFFRVDKARSRENGAFGLGLAIAKRCIELQHGRIELDSAARSGSVFRILLPDS